MVSLNREYELVLFGATGFTGRVTAEHIATYLPSDLVWALAGRSANKLNQLNEKVRLLNPDRLSPGIEIAELNKEDLDALAKKTKLVIAAVGPYSLYGTDLVEACARNGTHYLDVTGETPWVYQIIQDYHEQAKATGAIMIPQIGIESAPADLMTWTLVTALREKYSITTEEVIFTIHRIRGEFSGGTAATVLSILDVYSAKQLARSFAPWAFSPVPGVAYKDPGAIVGVRHVPELGTLTTSPNGRTDRTIVERSWGLMGQGSVYGPRFHYHGYITVRNTLFAVAWHILFTTFAALLFLSPVRWLLRKLVYLPGTGASPEATKRESIEVRALAISSPIENVSTGAVSRHRALAKMRYKGGIYYLTGVFLAEAAYVLLRGSADDQVLAKKLGGGILTPATLGQPFIDRLVKAGVEVEVEVLD
ncbi:MAG: hypothetical protein M1838_004232 [Thelocarpon superellum]|nr:MAG: hypothetical protein M1838_004232 [Thelocarpon superellum]